MCAAMFCPILDQYESSSSKLITWNLPLPAYDKVMKASQCVFNLLDARHANSSVTERTTLQLRVRT